MNGISSITTSYPLWFVLICVAVGALYSWALYSKKHLWNKKVNYLLATLRFLTVTIICLLLLDWMTEIKTTQSEKPIVLIGIDNSSSIASTTDSANLQKVKNQLKIFKSALEKEGKEVYVSNFNKDFTSIDSTDFDFQTSNINQLISNTTNSFEDRNLAGLVLLSDGVYNQGVSPEYSTYNTKIFTVALGDTTRKKDLKISSVANNKIAYKDNIFPIKVEIENTGFKNKNTAVEILQNGVVLESKTINFQSSFDYQDVLFQLSSKKEGIQHYVIKLKPLSGESSLENNTQHVYIEILNGKEKVLCVALAPHPDVKALKSAIENNSNIEFNTHIISRGDQLKLDEKYDLVIFHQVPNKLNKGNDIIDKINSKKIPKLFILGNQSNLSKFNNYNNSININSVRGKTDEISPYYDKQFDLFNIKDDLRSRLPKFPPLTVPYGNYSLKGGSQAILKQQVGSVQTTKACLVINIKNNIKEGVITGEGLWRWRLGEFQKHENTDAFDQTIQKTIQLLSAKNDKRKFRVTTNRQRFNQFDNITFFSESYNDLYEPIYNNEIDLKISNEKGDVKNIKFTPSNSLNTSHTINNLEEGLYKFTASTKLNGKQEYSSGQFIVTKRNLESLQLTADHRLLNILAKNHSGKMVYPDNLDELLKYFNGEDVVNILHTDTDRDALINHKWIFFLIFGLIATEWALRKNKGGY